MDKGVNILNKGGVILKELGQNVHRWVQSDHYNAEWGDWISEAQGAEQSLSTKFERLRLRENLHWQGWCNKN